MQSILICSWMVATLLFVDVSLAEVSRSDLPARVQEFLGRDDEKFEAELKEQSEEQVICLVFAT